MACDLFNFYLNMPSFLMNQKIVIKKSICTFVLYFKNIYADTFRLYRYEHYSKRNYSSMSSSSSS